MADADLSGDTKAGAELALTNEERTAIARQVSIELQIREQVERQAKKETPKNPVKSWLESNFVLLLIGSAITGLLVPYWQQHQETIKWQRQNQHDNYTYRLTQMRLCLQEFLNLTAYPSDANEISKPVLAKVSLSPKKFDQFAAQFRDLQQKRFHETTRVFALFIHFPRSEVIGVEYEKYTTKVAAFMSNIDALAIESITLATAKGSASKWKDLENRTDNLARHFGEINRLFDKVVGEMRAQIKEVEHESEKLK